MTTPREMTKEELEQTYRVAGGEMDPGRLTDVLVQSLEHIAVLEARAAAARDAALEEAKRDFAEQATPYTVWRASDVAKALDALKAQPAHRFVEALALLAALDRHYAGVRRKYEETGSDDPRKQKFAGMMAAYENVAADFGLNIDEATP